MLSTGDPDPAAVGQRICEALSVFIQEHVALGASDDQRRALDPVEVIAEIGQGRLEGTRIQAPAAVALPGQPPVGKLPQVVPKADPKAAVVESGVRSPGNCWL